ncbi:MAG TPA: DUF1206 domain-containing protein [Ktedonobacteraceae bacterium]|nr:DUF1206 domain-containing protein [Ktedonobacteraceae bacterium]
MQTRETIRQGAGEAKAAARGAATSRPVIWLARLGYAVRGLVYLIIGGLAVKLAVGAGGRATDQHGALQAISHEPFGKFLLIIVAIGLVGYALWKLIEALFDPDGAGRGAKGMASRVGNVVVGLAYASLALGAISIITGSGNGGKSSNASAQDWTARLLHQPFGVFLVVIVGLVFLAVACYLFYRAYAADFRKRLNLSSLNPQWRNWAILSGRLGYAALGVVEGIVGIFLIVAAVNKNASQAKGLSGALLVLMHQPFGAFLLALVALGLIAYGLYSFVEARYRRLP